MTITRSANAHWTGTGTAGQGNLDTPSKVLKQAQYSYLTRFADGIGTNPEELVAAAHAGCFSMKLAFNLQAVSLVPQSIDTRCELVLENGTIVSSHLQVEAVVPGLSPEQFEELVEDARQNCPVSKLLTVPVTAEALLKQTAVAAS
ncbi:OsmC family peroxiredoxin [Hymenobacter cavernae]|uniref:Peroxiredoxin n=1 Tax=Hymenobacter cavernae TaxID=2044852 RepID=A0ABQ1TER9_9BACT|nr:OsmC family peroxiredoxin [Hymenobacter cavernae]GGE93722.1 peroxiredoxin [Hymenobacter cavernae]